MYGSRMSMLITRTDGVSIPPSSVVAVSGVRKSGRQIAKHSCLSRMERDVVKLDGEHDIRGKADGEVDVGLE